MRYLEAGRWCALLFVPTALLAFTSHAAQASAQDVFGIALGKPINASVPECLKNAKGYANVPQPCFYMHSQHVIRIAYPLSMVPAYVKGNQISAFPIDGQVERIQIDTKGPSYDHTVLHALTEKFGQPNEHRMVPYTSQIDTRIATWSSPSVSVTYNSIWLLESDGVIWVSSKKWNDRAAQRSKESKSKKMPL